METIKATASNDDVLPFDEDAAVLAGFEEYHVDRTEGEVDDEDEDAHLGGQSQAAMELLDEASPIEESDKEDPYGEPTATLSAIECQSTASMPSTGSPMVDIVRSSATANSCQPDQISSFSGSAPDFAISVRPATASISEKADPISAADHSPARSSSARSDQSVQTSGPSPVRSRPDAQALKSNVSLVGKTAAAIRRRETGKTSFSRRDLPLPGRSKQMKK